MVVNSGRSGGFLDEEAYQWVRDVDLLSDEECLLPFAVGLDLNIAFLAAAARLTVGLSPPTTSTSRSSTRRSPAPGWWT